MIDKMIDFRISAYEESIEMYEERIAKLKNEIRRVGTDQDDTSKSSI